MASIIHTDVFFYKEVIQWVMKMAAQRMDSFYLPEVIGNRTSLSPEKRHKEMLYKKPPG
jgi:hypothetical protein